MPPRRKSKAGKKSSHARKKIGKGGKRKTHRKEQTFAIYIHKVLKQVHPDTGISRRAMNVVNCFSNDILDRLAAEAGRLARHQKRQTILKKDCEQAVKLIIRGELKKHAISEGTKAYFKYTTSINKPRA